MTASASPTNYVAISRRTLDLEDYIDVARRHVGWIIGPTLAGVVIAIVVAFILPNVYVSEAEMQITPAQISENIVKTTLNQQLNERIIQMENEILSRTSLSGIIQDPRLDLYKSDRAKYPLEDVIEDMRTKDIRIKIESSLGEGLRSRASAFSISFSYPDRVKAHDTVQALITKFQESSLNDQRTQQNVVNNYVHDELSEAKAKLDTLNEDLTKFRVENSGKLPEQSQLNMAQLNSVQQQLKSIDESLNRNAQDKVQLDQHIQSLTQQLGLFDMFDKELAPTAPAVRQQNDLALQLTMKDREIETASSALDQLRRSLTTKHPDLREAEAKLKQMHSERELLRKKQDEELAKQEEPKTDLEPAKKATNFQAAQSRGVVQSNIDATNAQIKVLEMARENYDKAKAKANKDIDVYQGKLAATSGIEATYAEMIANQRTAQEKYDKLLTTQELTEQNSELLQRKAGENLAVLDPPSLPTEPTKPNRWMIVGAGTAIAFMLGLALAGVQEAKDTSLKNLKDVRAYTNLPVLSSIPLLENTLLVRRKRRIAYLAWSAGVIIGILAVTGSLYYHYTYAV